MFAQGHVNELPESVIQPFVVGVQRQAEWTVHASAPRGILSGMVFAAVTRASELCGLEWSRLTGVFRGFSPVPTQEKEPSEGAQPVRNEVVNEKAFGVVRNKLAYQPDGAPITWGVDSYAELAVRPGPENARVGDHMGRRMPALTGLETCCGSGLWLVDSGRDAVLTAPGSSTLDMAYDMNDEDGEK